MASEETAGKGKSLQTHPILHHLTVAEGERHGLGCSWRNALKLCKCSLVHVIPRPRRSCLRRWEHQKGVDLLSMIGDDEVRGHSKRESGQI